MQCNMNLQTYRAKIQNFQKMSLQLNLGYLVPSFTT